MKNLTILLSLILIAMPVIAKADPYQDAFEKKQHMLYEKALADKKQRDDEFKKSLPAIKAKEKAMMDAEAKAEAIRQSKISHTNH